jgi:hypothetical protein
MTQIAGIILNPSDTRALHLIEARLPISDLIPLTIAHLALSGRASYHLFSLGSEVALP